MSRTYRRKKDSWKFEAYDYVYKNGYLEKNFYDNQSAEYRKEKAKFHKDGKFYGSSVPSDFVNLFCEKKLRQRTKQAIIKWRKNPDNVECMLPPYIHDAGWMYW